MRLLLDSNLSHGVAQRLRDAGFDAAHVLVVSEDTDVGQLPAEQRAATPSFVLLRTYEPLTPDEQVAVLVANLPVVRDELERGAIVVVERHRIRVRQLPILPPIPGPRRNP